MKAKVVLQPKSITIKDTHWVRSGRDCVEEVGRRGCLPAQAECLEARLFAPLSDPYDVKAPDEG